MVTPFACQTPTASPAEPRHRQPYERCLSATMMSQCAHLRSSVRQGRAGVGAPLRARFAALLVASLLASACDAQARDCTGFQRRPVIFVHGSGLSPDSWREMIAAFHARGYESHQLHAVWLTPNDGANGRAAEHFIQPAVRELLSQTRRRAQAAGCTAPRKVDIVAHSMGAVSSRWYVARMDATRVRNLVGIAPANHGTDALCGHAGDGNRELCPAFARTSAQSSVQVALNGSAGNKVDETPYGFGDDSTDRPRTAPTDTAAIYYWTIRIDPDEWIHPASSAILDGAGGRKVDDLPAGVRETSPGNFLWPPGVRHDDLPKQPQVIDFVIRLLEADR